MFSAATVATLETASQDLSVQRAGIIDIIDMAGFGWRQIKNFGPMQAKLTADLTDKILPVRFNQVMHQPRAIDQTQHLTQAAHNQIRST